MYQNYWLCMIMQLHLVVTCQSSILSGAATIDEAIPTCDMHNKSLYEVRHYIKGLHINNATHMFRINGCYSVKLIGNVITYYLKSLDFNVLSKLDYSRRRTYLCLISWFYEYFNVPVLIITDSSTEDHVNKFIQQQNKPTQFFSYQYTNNTVFRDVLYWKVKGYKLFVFLCSLKCYADIMTLASNANLHEEKYMWVTEKKEVMLNINPLGNMLIVDANSLEEPNPKLVECSYGKFKGTLSVKSFGLTIRNTHSKEKFPNIYHVNEKKSWQSLTSDNLKSIHLGEMNFPHRKHKTVVNVVTIIEPPFTSLSTVKPTLSGKICDIGNLCWVYEMLNTTLKVKVPYCCIGFCMDLLNELKKDLGIDVNMYLVEDSVYGGENNGTYNGLIGDLFYGKADIVLAAVTMYEWRFKIIDFTEPYMISGISIGTVVQKKGPMFFNFDLFSPISIRLWLSTFAIAMVLGFLLWYMEYLVAKRNIYPWKESILYQIGLVFQRDMGGQNPFFVSTRVIALCGALFMMILMSSYTAMLTAIKVTYSSHSTITGFKDDKITNPTNSFIYATLAHSGMAQLFRDSSKSVYRTMYEFMEKHNYLDTGKAIEDLKSGKLNAMIHDMTILAQHVSVDHDCSIQVVGDPIPGSGYSLATSKGSPWKSKISDLLQKYKESGFITRLEKKWLSNNCLIKSQEHTIDQAEMNSFGGLFIALTAASIVAIVIFIAEHMVWGWKYKACKTL